MRKATRVSLTVLLLSLGLAVLGTLQWLGVGQTSGRSSAAANSAVADADVIAEAAARRYAKPGADVELTGAPVYVLEPGESTELNLTLTNAQSQRLELEIRADDGLVVSSSQHHWQFDPGTERVVLTPTVTGSVPGRHFLHLFATTTDSQGSTAHRTFAVEVRVGVDTALQLHYKDGASPPPARTHIPLDVVETIR